MRPGDQWNRKRQKLWFIAVSAELRRASSLFGNTSARAADVSPIPSLLNCVKLLVRPKHELEICCRFSHANRDCLRYKAPQISDVSLHRLLRRIANCGSRFVHSVSRRGQLLLSSSFFTFAHAFLRSSPEISYLVAMGAYHGSGNDKSEQAPVLS